MQYPTHYLRPAVTSYEAPHGEVIRYSTAASGESLQNSRPAAPGEEGANESEMAGVNLINSPVAEAAVAAMVSVFVRTDRGVVSIADQHSSMSDESEQNLFRYPSERLSGVRQVPRVSELFFGLWIDALA